VVEHADAFSGAFLQPCAAISWAVFGRGARLLSYRDLALTFGIFVLTNDANLLRPAVYEVSDNVDFTGLIKRDLSTYEWLITIIIHECAFGNWTLSLIFIFKHAWCSLFNCLSFH
jgi:hypothetical protein